MIKICEKRSLDGTRRAEVWDNDGSIRLMLFENEKLVHWTELGGTIQSVENLAENYCLKESTPDLLFD